MQDSGKENGGQGPESPAPEEKRKLGISNAEDYTGVALPWWKGLVFGVQSRVVPSEQPNLQSHTQTSTAGPLRQPGNTAERPAGDQTAWLT